MLFVKQLRQQKIFIPLIRQQDLKNCLLEFISKEEKIPTYCKALSMTNVVVFSLVYALCQLEREPYEFQSYPIVVIRLFVCMFDRPFSCLCYSPPLGYDIVRIGDCCPI